MLKEILHLWKNKEGFELRKMIIIWLYRMGDLKETNRNTQNAALNVDLFQKIFCDVMTAWKLIQA